LKILRYISIFSIQLKSFRCPIWSIRYPPE